VSAQTFSHGRLGTFTPFDDGVELWGEAQWLGERCKLVLVVDEAGEANELAATACALLDQADRWDAEARRAALALYGLWESEWRGPDHPALSEAEWITQLRFAEISVYPEGEFEISLDAAGLFAGHVILISGSLSGGLGEADIAG
jgi:hypothetical protein